MQAFSHNMSLQGPSLVLYQNVPRARPIPQLPSNMHNMWWTIIIDNLPYHVCFLTCFFAIQGNIITGTRSIIGFANGTLWRENSTPSIYDYKIEGVACFDADSDIITPYGNESESSFCFMDGEV